MDKLTLLQKTVTYLTYGSAGALCGLIAGDLIAYYFIKPEIVPGNSPLKTEEPEMPNLVRSIDSVPVDYTSYFDKDIEETQKPEEKVKKTASGWHVAEESDVIRTGVIHMTYYEGDGILVSDKSGSPVSGNYSEILDILDFDDDAEDPDSLVVTDGERYVEVTRTDEMFGVEKETRKKKTLNKGRKNAE